MLQKQRKGKENKGKEKKRKERKMKRKERNSVHIIKSEEGRRENTHICV